MFCVPCIGRKQNLKQLTLKCANDIQWTTFSQMQTSKWASKPEMWQRHNLTKRMTVFLIYTNVLLWPQWLNVITLSVGKKDNKIHFRKWQCVVHAGGGRRCDGVLQRQRNCTRWHHLRPLHDDQESFFQGICLLNLSLSVCFSVSLTLLVCLPSCPSLSVCLSVSVSLSFWLDCTRVSFF